MARGLTPHGTAGAIVGAMVSGPADRDERILHVERAPLWPLWASLAAVAAVGAALIATGRTDSGGALIIIGALVWLTAVAPLVVSRRRYNSITVTTKRLRVGRDEFSLADLDRSLLRRQAEGEVIREWPDDPLFGRTGTGATVAGGAFGPAVWDRTHLRLGVAGHPAVLAVATRHPARLARIILEAAERDA